jgi:hypothetical protein
MNAKPLAVLSVATLTGCAALGPAPQSTRTLDAEIVLSLLESRTDSRSDTPSGESVHEATAHAPGPSLIAGDSIAFAWVLAHRGTTDFAVANWHPGRNADFD